MKWQKRLTKKEMRHLRETQNGQPTIAALKRNIEGAAQNGDRCIECQMIARKLGIKTGKEGKL